MKIGKDLRTQLGPVRDQGLRTTCLAFAISAAHEAHLDRHAPLSPEWLYFHAIQRAGDDPNAGLKTPNAIETLKIDGQPDEACWPYCPQTPASPWRPPGSPKVLYRADGNETTFDISIVRAAIDAFRPVILTLLIDGTFNTWHTEENVAIIWNAPPPFGTESGHAVVAVGHGMMNGHEYILVRNSWGEQWGDGGHAWLRDDYLVARVYGAIQLKEHSVC